MRRVVFTVIVLGWLLAACTPPSGPLPSSQQDAVSSSTPVATSTPHAQTASLSQVATATHVPTVTSTATATPDYTQVGLPTEESGTLVQDFVADVCRAEWFTRAQELTCPGNDSQAQVGYVQILDGQFQGYSSDIGVLMMYPPEKTVETIASKYPAITVKKGDRFRAVLDCRAHSACDVEFFLNFYTSKGSAGLTHWRHMFADGPIIVDYSLDALAGQNVQFSLGVYSKGNRTDGYAVWIAPHIYRPAP